MHRVYVTDLLDLQKVSPEAVEVPRPNISVVYFIGKV